MSRDLEMDCRFDTFEFGWAHEMCMRITHLPTGKCVHGRGMDRRALRLELLKALRQKVEEAER